jgi:DnaK suppressor protein
MGLEMTEPTGTVIVLPEGYRPGEDEAYMNPLMLEYFRHQLLAWKADILSESRSTIGQLRDDNAILPDLVDRAASETGKALELRTRDRQRKLISKIEAALRRVDSGDYGWCEETGDPIGVARLEARPTATLCLEAQERHERAERVHRDD